MTAHLSKLQSRLRQFASFSLAVAVCLAPVRAQDQAATAQAKTKHTMYTFKDLGTLGGTFSQAFFVNNFGSLGGYSALSNGDFHAFLVHHGSMKDLGTLGGPNSVDFGSPNERGQLAGEAETSTPDPKGEDYCGFGTHLVCAAVVWEATSPDQVAMTPLPALKGSTNAQAAWLNNRGEIAGSSENGKADSTCPSGISQVTEFKPVVWYKPFSWFKAQITELPTPKGDPDGVVLSINDKGHAVGTTGSCGVFNPNQFTNLSQVSPQHAVLWRNGHVIDLKGLGGELGNTAFAINDSDQVVGVTDLAGDANFHAFLWENAHVTDLPPLEGDINSVGLGINERGQIAGLSLAADFNLRAVIWEKGEPNDLGELATPGSTIIPFVAEWINDRGEIAGWGLDTNTGEIHPFLAVPTCDVSKGSAGKDAKPHLSDSARRQMLLHMRLGKSLSHLLDHQ